jgi:hypothetical protein
MDKRQDITEEQLLDYLLERCDQAQASRIAAALQEDTALEASYRRLTRTLEPLEAWNVPAPPQRLVEQILDGIAAQNPPRLVPAASTIPPDSGDAARRPLLSLRELVALAACITIFVGVFVPTMSTARFNSRQQMCASNMGSIFRGMNSYATANAGFLPSARRPAQARFLAQAGRRPTPDRDHLFQLVKLGNVAPGRLTVFVCPARKGDRPMAAEKVDTSDGFADPNNCSYDVQRTARPMPVLARFVMPLPLLGDANPLFEEGRFNQDLDPATANSTSHRGAGQNLLLLDGRVIWQATPIFEPTGDNIWQVGRLRVYTGTEASTSATDTFLAP